MAGRATLLTARAAGELLDHIRTRDGAEPAERIVGAQLIGYADGASAIAALQRDGLPLCWCGTAAAEAGLVGVANDKAAAMALKFGQLPTTGEPIRTAIHTIPGKDGENRERAELDANAVAVVIDHVQVRALAFAALQAAEQAGSQAVDRVVPRMRQLKILRASFYSLLLC